MQLVVPIAAEQQAAVLRRENGVVAAEAAEGAGMVERARVDQVVERVARAARSVDTGRLAEDEVLEPGAERPARVQCSHRIDAAGIAQNDILLFSS